MSNISGSFYTTASNLSNTIPVQEDINEINRRITGIDYNDNNTTIISNDVVITSPSTLTVNGINVYQSINNNTIAINALDVRVDNVELILTDISYNLNTTTISNNVVIATPSTLTLNGENVNTQITTLEDKTTGIEYDFTFDNTTISNNVVIPIDKTLTLNGQDVNSRLTSLENKTFDLSYNNISDTTTISSNVVIPTDKTLTLNGMNVYESINNNTGAINALDGRVDNVELTLTDISYDSNTTTISNNVVITPPGTLTLNGVNVYESNINNTLAINALDGRMDNVELILTDISYDSNTTTISNNVVITTPNTLTLNGINVYESINNNTGAINALDGRMDNVELTLTDISYDSNTTTISNNVVIATPGTLTLNGQNVNTRFNTIENNINGISYNAGTDNSFWENTEITLTGTIVLNGYTDLSGNSINGISNVYINSGGNVYIGTDRIDTSILLTLNNVWLGSNDFTDNDCRVSTQVANTSTTLAASTEFVQQQFDYFLSHNNIYTGGNITQNFTNTNITVPTQGNTDTSQKASNSVFVNNKIDQFRINNQTFTGTITFSSQPYISSSIPVLDRGTAITTTGAVARDVGIDPVGYRTYFDDFYNQGIYFGQERDNDVFTCRDANIQYQVNTNAQVSYIPYFQSINSQTAGHPGILACYTGGAAGRYAILNWYSNLYPFNTNNLASYECMVSNASVSTTNSTFYCTVGMTDQLFNNTNGYFWYYDAGVWKALVRKAGVTVVYGTVGSGWASPLRNKWIKLRMDYFVSGANITINWYYNNFTDNLSETFTTTIANISGIDLGPTFRLEAGNSTEVIMYLDFQVVKYYANRG